MSDTWRAYLAPLVAAALGSAATLGVLLVGRVVRPRRAGSTDATTPARRR